MGSWPSTVILVPVLGRPHRVEPFLTSLWEATTETFRVLFLANETDADQLAAIRAAGADVLTVKGRGTYPQKINAGYRETTEPVMFLAADDVRFHVGWLGYGLERIAEGFDVVGTNDLGNQRVMDGDHSTHTFVTRAYANQPGGAADEPRSVMHEGYRHWCCDDELVGMAKKRRVWSFCAESVVEHLHPYWQKGQMDNTYRRGERSKVQDQRLRSKRVGMWT